MTLHGFNDLGRSVTPIFLSMGHFLYRFSMFCEKMKKNLSSRNFRANVLKPTGVLSVSDHVATDNM